MGTRPLHWSRAEANIWSVAPPSLARGAGGRVVRGKEGKDISSKATDDEHILARIPNFQIPKSLASQATQVETFLVCRTAIAGEDEVFDF